MSTTATKFRHGVLWGDEVTELFGQWCEIEKFNSGSPEMFKDKVEAVEGVYYLTVN